MIWLRPVEPKNAVFATRGILYFLDEELHQPIPAERFETARGFLIGYTRQTWEQTDQRRLGYAIDELYYGAPPPRSLPRRARRDHPASRCRRR